jgi:hypothetical protein
MLPRSNLFFIGLAILLIAGGGWLMFRAGPIYHWGVDELAGEREETLWLGEGEEVAQNLGEAAPGWEGILLLLTREGGSKNGQIKLVAERGKERREVLVSSFEILPSGEQLFSFQPFKAGANQSETAKITLRVERGKVGIRWRPGATVGAGAMLYYVNAAGEREKLEGALAWRLRFRKPWSSLLPLTPLLLTLAGWGAVLLLWLVSRQEGEDTTAVKKHVPLSPRAVFAAAAVIALIYAPVLLRLGEWWPTNGDFLNDTLLVQSAGQAWREGKPPLWHHSQCGGMPLLGNLNGHVLGPAAWLAMWLPAERALGLVLLLMLAMILPWGAAKWGALMGLRSIGQFLLAAALGLTGFVAFRLNLGHTMFVAAWALVPWVLWAWEQAQISRKMSALLWGSFGLVLMFWQGDTHILLYTLMLLGGVALWRLLICRQILPLITLFALLAGAMLLGAPKFLVALEGRSAFMEKLPAAAAALREQGLWWRIFLDRTYPHAPAPVHFANPPREAWENIGLYIGPLLILFALLAVYCYHRKYPRLHGYLFAALLLIGWGEGSIYAYGLRNIPAVASFGRFPSRVLVMVVLVLALWAGVAVSAWWVDKRGNWKGKILAGIAAGAVVLDLGSFSLGAMKHFPHLKAPPELPALPSSQTAVLTLTPEEHPYVWTRRGSTVPGLCPEYPRFPEFAEGQERARPLAKWSMADGETKPAKVRLAPNELRLQVPPDAVAITLRTRYWPLLQSSQGMLLDWSRNQTRVVGLQIGNLILSYRSDAWRPGWLWFGAGLSLVFALRKRQIISPPTRRTLIKMPSFTSRTPWAKPGVR